MSTAQPIIWIGAIEQDDSYLMFETQIENRGGGSVIAHIYAAKLEDSNGRRVRRIDRAIELHWRGYRAEEKAILYGDKHEIAGIFQTVTEWESKPIYPTPCLTAPGPPGVLAYSVVPLRDPAPLEKQEIVYLTIRVDFHEIRHEIAVSMRLHDPLTPEETDLLHPVWGCSLQYCGGGALRDRYQNSPISGSVNACGFRK